ncbi:MAG: peptide-binding protein [Candidatus Omnitrophota bacterium]|jgi:peptide/nickel transport system substrate-binding protein
MALGLKQESYHTYRQGNIVWLKVFIERLSLLVIAFFVYASAPAQDYGDAYVSGSIADARTLIPILASDSASSEICSMIFNGLVKYDKDVSLVGDLAQSWEIQNEGLTIIFHLRKNVSWHDGRPFTARDVEFTYMKLIDPGIKTPYSGDFERVQSFTVIDDYTIKVTYKEPFAPGLSSWGMPIMPRHILENQDFSNTPFSRHPVGTGPYCIKSWKSQEKIELVSYREYFEKRPYIDRYISRVIPDEATTFLELQTQGIDSSSLTPLQYLRQTDTPFFRKHYRKFNLPNFSYIYLGYNLSNPKFSDKRVRQALNYAVNKKEVIDMVLLGLGRPLTGPFIPGSWAYNPLVIEDSFDQKKARELLKDAGWVDNNADGWLEKEGKIFEFTIITNQGNLERIKVAEIIQRQLESVGVKVKIKVVEWSVFLTEFINKKNFESVLLGWSLSRDPDNFDIFHSSKTREGEFNFVGYRNPQVDDLLVEARRVFDQEKRKVYYHKIHQLIYDDQPYMFLYAPDNLTILQARFKGIKPAPLGIGYNFIDWWVEKKEQRYNRISSQ